MTDDERKIQALSIIVERLATNQDHCQNNQNATNNNISALVAQNKKLSDAIIELVGRVDNLAALDRRIAKLEDNQKWGVRAIGGLVLAAIAKIIVDYNIITHK
jgi:uncharacterized protein HemX